MIPPASTYLLPSTKKKRGELSCTDDWGLAEWCQYCGGDNGGDGCFGGGGGAGCTGAGCGGGVLSVAEVEMEVEVDVEILVVDMKD